MEELKDPFDFVERLDSEILSDFIINEHPQVIAVILYYIESQKSVEVLTYYSLEMQAEIIYRMHNIKNISNKVIEIISTTLEQKLTLLNTESSIISGEAKVMEILKGINTSEEIITKIQKFDDDFLKNTTEGIQMVNNSIIENLDAIDAELDKIGKNIEDNTLDLDTDIFK